MTCMRNNEGMISVEDSSRILYAVFPNYPKLEPCNPAPPLEPIATATSEDATLEGAVAS